MQAELADVKVKRALLVGDGHHDGGDLLDLRSGCAHFTSLNGDWPVASRCDGLIRPFA
jgi:hypothetical protein